MLDVAWPELIVIGAVALIAIPPKDLPKVMHTLGLWVGKMRHLAHDVHHTIDRISYEAEVAERLRKQEQSPPAATAAAPNEAPSHPQAEHEQRQSSGPDA